MKKNFDIRLAALREYLKSLSADETVFIVEGGGEFRTAEDAFTYLRKYGAVTPDGKRIVLYPHPVEGVDPLSLSLYQMIDEAIEQGKLELPELESDEIGGKALNNGIKARLASLQAIAAQEKTGAAIMTLLENGAWAACRAPQSPAKVFQTQEAARDYLSDCECVIIIDL